jgi:hypothetical protein
MTDAAPAPALTDVWNLLLAVVGRQPIQLQVMIVLAALVVLIMIVDGVRANLFRRKPQDLLVVRKAYERPRALAAPDGKSPPTRAFKTKRNAPKRSPHKAPRPQINRVPLEEPPQPAVYQPNEWLQPREEEAAPL